MANESPNVWGEVRLSNTHSKTGKTKHTRDGRELPRPALLRIVRFVGDPGYYLLRLNESDEELTDTYHDGVQEALEQAEWEYGVKPAEWQTADAM